MQGGLESYMKRFWVARVCFGLGREGFGDVILGFVGVQFGFAGWCVGFSVSVGCVGTMGVELGG